MALARVSATAASLVLCGANIGTWCGRAWIGMAGKQPRGAEAAELLTYDLRKCACATNATCSVLRRMVYMFDNNDVHRARL